MRDEYERRAVDDRTLVRNMTRMDVLDSIIRESDNNCIWELRMSRNAFARLCELLIVRVMEVQKRGRRSWTQEEDEILLTILEELVVEGHRGENGTFKAGTHEEALKRMLIRVPGINLTVQQIVNKMKRWSLKLSEALDMMNTSGFGWDDVRKCVVVDNPQVLEEYLKKHPKSANHANKEFKEFERLHVIFGKDRATGHGAETPADVIETQSLQPEWENMMETQSSQQPESPMSRRQESPISNIGSQSEGSEPKKK
ncbi:hypothetical protein Cni_G01123 [Canna indica]|uniref:Myb/SANT-like domain-containing protein n=1 Tax=Canna indica TaxID=4628 RepID=A0AAQ3JNT6_9LILI|nr:hypothetical protein Cni_G01123 [Canna indica]